MSEDRVTDAALTRRLADLPSLAGIPHDQLEWLASRGELQRFETGAVMYSSQAPPSGCYVVLSGRIAVRATSDGMARTVNELQAGDFSGRLPYSRMAATGTAAPQATTHLASVAEEPVEILVLPASQVREMTRACYELTARCVHQMIDRTRLFKSDDLQREKMASLGRLAAGLAHELNNPSSAAARSARVMDTCRRDVVAATRALYAAGLTDEALAAVEALEARTTADTPAGSPLDDADREDQVLEWCEARNLDSATASALASTPVSVADLEAAAAIVPAAALPAALKYVAANAMAMQLTAEIEHATRRIDVLVAAVKRHTHMDQAPAVDAVDLRSALSDTLTLAAAKARARNVSLTLDVEPDLPALSGVPGQLSDAWMNLVDNAIDAAPAGGHVTVSARPGPDTIVVSVIDDGPGIPLEDQAKVFEPFFTTKPVGQGAGLGLDVVQRVVRSHGGSVELGSRPGRTEFRVTLPAHA